ncbi:hypothetical protein [Nocardioides kribbensis]|uniref:Uncharacterized protein n=1 Tax=Nocardioides kribbensis TaxID=305517 RepID=A0ABV1NY52_9ACTN
MFAAFLLAETTTQQIVTFLANAKSDHNGDLYVDRRLPKDDNGDPKTPTTGSPPGAPPVIEVEPDDDEEAA